MELKSDDRSKPHSRTSPYCKRKDDTNIPFSIYHQNIQGLKSKINEFLLSLLPETPHLICFSEHHSHYDEINNIHIPEYNLAANYCRRKLKCGGVSIFVQEDIKFSTINLTKFNKDQDLEISAVKLKILNTNIIVFCTYRAPTGDIDYFLKNIDVILNRYFKPRTEIIICGDLNINFMDNKSNNKIRLEQVLSTYNLMGIVDFPTRITGTSSTLIDNIFIDTRNTYTVKPHVNGISDHDGQLLKIFKLDKSILRNNGNYHNVTRIINDSTSREFQYLLSLELWEDVFAGNDVDIMFNNFLNTYLRCFYTTHTKRSISKPIKSHTDWITQGIKISCKRKRELYILYRTSKDNSLKLYYKKYCAILTKIIQYAKKHYYNNMILNSKNKMKATWQIINKERGTKFTNKQISSLTIKDVTITNQSIIATQFNKFFTSVADTIRYDKNIGSTTKNQDSMKYLHKAYTHSFTPLRWEYATTYEVQQAIKTLKTKSASGYDEISNIVIKLSAPYIISPLTYICNSIFNNGIFPDRLKYAVVTPVYKKGSKQNISNYRPISILPSFSKVVEKLIYNRLYKHFEINDILTQNQFGFRKHYSTDEAAFCLIDNILSALNNRQRVGGIFCDIQKAFDCVNHKILLDKLYFYGIKGKFLSLIESYLSNRYQKTVLNKNDYNQNSSEWLRLSCGVPQGSILGPLLFLIYVNDLPSIINRKDSIVLFADDTSAIITNNRRDDFFAHVNQFFKDINNWLDNNLLNLNFGKTYFVEFTSKKQCKSDLQVQHNYNHINNTTHTKFLGLILDDTLSWSQHILHLTKKLSSACYAMRYIKYSLPFHTLKLIYFSYFHAAMSYGLIFWGSSPGANKIFILQKKIIRIIYNVGHRESCRDFFRRFQIFTLYSQYIYSLVLFTIKNIHIFSVNNEIHKHNTRNSNNLHPTIVKLSKYRKGPYMMCVKVFNHLPQLLKNKIGQPVLFRSLLRRFLYHHSFYTIQEYFDCKTN